MPIWPARSPGMTRQNCTMATTPSMVKRYSSFPILRWVYGRRPDFLPNSVRRMRSQLGGTADNHPRWRHRADNPHPKAGLRPFRYIAPLYAVFVAKFRIEQRVWLNIRLEG